MLDEIDYCMDQTDAFVFSKKGDSLFGGNGPVAVVKESGECINFISFLDGDYDTKIVSERFV